jgi:exodeoxyribonuclease III
MKIATWNVNGVRARGAQIHDWIARERPDVVCLQEIKAAPDAIPFTLTDIEDYWCYWHGAKGYSGVALHVRRDVSGERPSFSHPPFDYESRIVSADLATDCGPITVASIYAPNGGKDFPAKMRFLEAMDAYAAGFDSAGRPLIMCGDLNVARTDMDVHPKERKPRATGQLPEERALIERIISHGLVDVQRTLDPDNAELFTWWAPWRNMKQRNIGWRLDYVLATRSIADRAASCVVQREVGTSDHGPVVAVFDEP